MRTKNVLKDQNNFLWRWIWFRDGPQKDPNGMGGSKQENKLQTIGESFIQVQCNQQNTCQNCIGKLSMNDILPQYWLFDRRKERRKITSTTVVITVSIQWAGAGKTIPNGTISFDRV